jgi:hypothetical protein
VKNTVGENCPLVKQTPGRRQRYYFRQAAAGLHENWLGGPWLGYTTPREKKTKEGAGWADFEGEAGFRPMASW